MTKFIIQHFASQNIVLVVTIFLYVNLYDSELRSQYFVFCTSTSFTTNNFVLHIYFVIVGIRILVEMKLFIIRCLVFTHLCTWVPKTIELHYNGDIVCL